MTTTQTPTTGGRGGSTPSVVGHQPITSFWFETAPTQDEVRARLAAADTARHAAHEQADPFCLLCPAVRRAPLTHLSAVCGECGGLFEPADGETDTVCDSCAMTEPDDEPHHYQCPTCGGNGCRPCQGTGERLDTTHRPIGQDS